MVMYGKNIAGKIKSFVAEQAKRQKAKGVIPKVVFLTVGEDPVSARYTRGLVTDCAEAGILAEVQTFPDSVSEDKLVNVIRQLNRATDVHGITLQFPLPRHLNDSHTLSRIVNTISADKDVDGLRSDVLYHISKGNVRFHPCTTDAIMAFLQTYKISCVGASVVVAGRSTNVGLPAALMLQEQNATVSVIHSETPKDTSRQLLKNADIVVLATGQAHHWNELHFKPGATIIDVGTSMKDGKLVGDFDDTLLKEAGDTESFNYTPVPNGVGIVTRAMFLQHVVHASMVQTSN